MVARDVETRRVLISRRHGILVLRTLVRRPPILWKRDLVVKEGLKGMVCCRASSAAVDVRGRMVTSNRVPSATVKSGSQSGFSHSGIGSFARLGRFGRPRGRLPLFPAEIPAASIGLPGVRGTRRWLPFWESRACGVPFSLSCRRARNLCRRDLSRFRNRVDYALAVSFRYDIPGATRHRDRVLPFLSYNLLSSPVGPVGLPRPRLTSIRTLSIQSLSWGSER